MTLQLRGISYVPAATTHAVRRDLRAIAEQLHCTTVMLIDTDTERQVAAAEYALELGLDVYLRPYLADRPRAELLAQLSRTAVAAEELRRRHPGRVTLLLGSEFSLTSRGMLPGRWLFLRVQVLIRWRRFFDRRITRKLNVLLRSALATARGQFHGPITYAAGYWEQVDWSGFDLVGVNLYRFGNDPAAYAARLDRLVAETTKPVVVTEFGCGSFAGADQRGPGSFLAVNWFANPPTIKPGHVRDEATQAAYLAELITLYAARGVHGCFVFTFSMADFPHSADPLLDLDLAGFGVVRISADDPGHWLPKQAFAEVARLYSGSGSGSGTETAGRDAGCRE
ncbi:hypothetical protein [Kribbella sp. CA-293567]|uniref:hypothetical protein n=1 Tax=Kribbella sp. CA-293567 TaxID=3002436 RepID=UPI0022DE4DF5|nr:hypothetical protein [Kribbella sp. CA-293567]WBQ05709.1 hypothetical protein OX958_02645 [Kribbella sp. CA-293567]